MRSFVLTILGLLLSSHLMAQAWHVESYTMDQGLPSELIKDLYQDRQGRLWIATDQGLSVYNGKYFNNIEKPLSSHYTKKLLPLPGGQLLLATDLGIDLLNFKNNHINAQQFIAGQSMVSDSTVSYPKTIFTSKNGTIWIGEKGYIIQYQPGDQRLRRYYTSSEDISKSFTHSFLFSEDEQQQLWALSYPGRLLKLEGGIFTAVPMSQKISNATCWSYQGNGVWLVGSYNGFYELSVKEGKAEVKKVLDLPWIKRMAFRQNGDLYLGTRDQGVCRVWKGQDSRWNKAFIPETSGWTINAMIPEIQGRGIWIGTDEGVKLLIQPFFTTLPLNGELPTIHQIIESAEREIIIATGRAIYLLKKDFDGRNPSRNAELLWKFDGSYAMCIALSNNYLWIGKSSCEIQRIHLKTRKSDSFTFGNEDPAASHVEAIWANEAGTAVLGSKTNSQGFYVLDFSESEASPRITHYGTLDGITGTVNVIKGSKGIAYIGSEGKDSYLFSYNPQSQKLSNLSKKLPNGADSTKWKVFDLCVSKNQQQLLIGSSQGLWQWNFGSAMLLQHNANSNYTLYSYNPVFGIEATHQQIWAIGNEGINSLTPDGWIKMDKNSGLPSATIKPKNLLIDSNKRLWVGTAKGATYVKLDTASFIPPSSAPEIHQLTADGRSIKSKGDANYGMLPHGIFLSAEIAPLSYPQQSVQYQSRLLPLDSLWSPPKKEANFSFSDLEAGEYELQLRAQNVNGHRWSVPKSIYFSIEDPWYAKWPNLIFMLIAAYFLLFIGIRLYTYRLRRTKKKLAKTVDEHMAESIKQNRLLNQQKEEIAKQRDYIHERNEALEKAQKTIELQNHQLTEANQLLERKVRQRTRELNRAMTELQESNAELDYFIYRSAHDLRGPIARMSGLAKLISHFSEHKEVDECISHMTTTIQKMEELLDRLLEILELKSAEPIWHETDLQKLLQKCIEPWRANQRINDSNISFSGSYWPFIRTDIDLFSRIIDNLLRNSLDFKRHNTPLQIEFSCEERGTRVLLLIKDNGTGIDEGAQPKIFDLFYKGSEYSKGSGLGLYEARTLIHKLNGDIRLLRSKAGETVFELSFPLG